jgi:predicted transcriptional regulator YdeE
MTTTTAQPTFKELGALKLAGIRYEGRNQNGEIPMMWDVFLPRVHEIVPEFAAHGAVLYGVCRDLPGATDGSFEYLAAAEVAAFDHLPQGFIGWDVPAHLYVALPVQGLSKLGEVINYFYQQWLPASQDYEMDGMLMMEVYPPGFADEKLDLYFPVKHK